MNDDEKTTCQYCNETSFLEDMDCMGACGDCVFCPVCGYEISPDGIPHVCDPKNEECLRVSRMLSQDDAEFERMIVGQRVTLAGSREKLDDA